MKLAEVDMIGEPFLSYICQRRKERFAFGYRSDRSDAPSSCQRVVNATTTTAAKLRALSSPCLSSPPPLPRADENAPDLCLPSCANRLRTSASNAFGHDAARDDGGKCWCFSCFSCCYCKLWRNVCVTFLSVYRSKD